MVSDRSAAGSTRKARPLTAPLTARLDRLVEELTAEGGLTPQWRETFLAVPRHLFIPDTMWQHDPAIDGPNDLVPVHRSEQHDRWLEIACANRSVTVQVDDGHLVSPDGRGRDISSSASHPGIVAQMLAASGAQPDCRIAMWHGDTSRRKIIGHAIAKFGQHGLINQW